MIAENLAATFAVYPGKIAIPCGDALRHFPCKRKRLIRQQPVWP